MLVDYGLWFRWLTCLLLMVLIGFLPVCRRRMRVRDKLTQTFICLNTKQNFAKVSKGQTHMSNNRWRAFVHLLLHRSFNNSCRLRGNIAAATASLALAVRIVENLFFFFLKQWRPAVTWSLVQYVYMRRKFYVSLDFVVYDGQRFKEREKIL